MTMDKSLWGFNVFNVHVGEVAEIISLTHRKQYSCALAVQMCLICAAVSCVLTRPLSPCKQMPVDMHESPSASSSKGRSLRRTVSVPSEGPFPDYPAEGASMLGKLPRPTAEVL